MSAEPNITDIIAYYHDLCTPTMAADTWSDLEQGMRARRLYFGERPLTTVLRPHLLTQAQWKYVVGECELLISAFNKVYNAMMADATLRRQVALTPEEEYLITLETGYETPVPTARLDSFFSHDGTLQFVEYNAESPAAMAYEDVLSEVFLQTPLIKKFQARYPLTPLWARQHAVDAILEIYYAWRGNRGALPTIAIVDWHGVPTANEFILFQEYFAQQGIRAVIVSPDELEYRNGVMLAHGAGGGLAVDFIYKRVLSTELLERYGLDHPIIHALADGKICMMNPFRCKLLHKKASFAVVGDERNQHFFTRAERAALDAHIPWTRMIEERKTLFHGQEVDLLPFALENKDRLVIKPNDEYGGKGVVIGWETDSVAWEKALQSGLPENAVVQERVQIAYEDFPALASDGQVQISQRLVDCDPFVFHGRMIGGCLTRLSTVTLLNVTAGGGSTVPTFVV